MSIGRLGAFFGAAAALCFGAVEIAACSSFSGAADATAETSVLDASDATLVDVIDVVDALPFDASLLIAVPSVGYSIEATEVTNVQFSAFRAVFGPQAGSPWAECPAKEAIGPTLCTTLSKADDQPVTCVDFCDATSYCAAIGRYLCGARDDDGGGGHVDPASGASSSLDQWTHACMGPTGLAYGYSDTASPDACNTYDGGMGTVVTVTASTQCSAGEPGVLDMIGNVAEWENACSGDGGVGSPYVCNQRGGNYQSTTTSASCTTIQSGFAPDAVGTVGFRCCATP